MFRLQGIKSTNPIAVGDKVNFELEAKNNTQTGVINQIEERKNILLENWLTYQNKLILVASNINQVFLFITRDNPPTFKSFRDRFLVTAEAYSVKAILLLNKIDTYNNEKLLQVKYLESTYKQIGYGCVEISIHNI